MHVQERIGRRLLNALLANGVHAGLLLPDTSVCGQSWKRLDVKNFQAFSLILP